LAQEEALAHKKIQETQRRASQFRHTRHKYDIDQSTIHQHRYKVQNDTEIKREMLRQERINSYERKKVIRMSMIENKLHEGLLVKQGLQDGFRSRDYRANDNMRYKMEKVRVVQDFRKRCSISKVDRQAQLEMNNKKRVDSLMNKDQSRATSNINKMTELEQKEISIMERLKTTLSQQQKAVHDFESMVMSKDRSINK
jgi:hypothetical protein